MFMTSSQKVADALIHLKKCSDCSVKLTSSEDPLETRHYWRVRGYLCGDGKKLVDDSENRFLVVPHLYVVPRQVQ